MTSPRFQFVDLFAGIGGIGQGFAAHGGQCVFASEYDKFAAQTYEANHDTTVDRRDIRQVASSEIPSHDILLAGFPCQPFSQAGVSKRNALGAENGFSCKAQGNLFFEVVRILQAHQPQAFFLENVKHLCGHDGGKTFWLIRRTLERMGYSFSYRIIDGVHWVPQCRQRVFMVGLRDSQVFDFDTVDIPAQRPTLKAILHNGEFLPPYTQQGRVNPKYILSDHLWGYLQAYAQKHAARGNGFGYGLVGAQDTTRTLSARYYKDGSEILVRRPGPSNPRRLTPRECARLMGFNDTFSIPVSDTQAYRQFGNSVVVPAIKAVAKEVVKCLNSGARD